MTAPRSAALPPRPPPCPPDPAPDAFARWFLPALVLVVLLFAGALAVVISRGPPPDPCDPYVLREGECPRWRPRFVIASSVPLCLCQGHPPPSSLSPETAP